ncbi:MAG TPA: VOC family protein [Mycobacteriales bacterium]|jgi:hypothetical protein
MLVDHVTFVVLDGDETAARFRDEHGLASFAGGYLPHLGARSWGVPLAPPQYLEWLQIDDPSIAERIPTGRRALEWVARGGGLSAWSVMVDDVHAASTRVGIDVYAGSTTVAGGAVRRWYTVTRDLDLPVLIAYEDQDARRERQRAAYEGIGHTCSPGGIAGVEVGNDPAELDAWLGPHDLPVTYVDAPPGIAAVTVETAAGPLRLT